MCENGTQGWGWYFTNPDGSKYLVAPGEVRWEKAPDGRYRSYFLTPERVKSYFKYDFEAKSWNAPKIKLDLETGNYRTYFLADDGSTIWATKDLFQHVKEGGSPDLCRVGKYSDGTYRFYMVADDGTKIWDDVLRNEIVPQRFYRNVNIGKGADGIDRYYVYADDGTKIFGKPVT